MARHGSRSARLRVKLAEHEFEAEGPAQEVTKQFSAFQELLADGHGTPTSTARHTAVPGLRHDKTRRLLILSSLPAGPNKEAEAILLLLLGHRELRDEELVPVTTLNRGLRESGCRIRRADRAIAGAVRDGCVVKLGTAKGTKYRLTQRGVQRAQEIAQVLSRFVAGG